MTGTPPALSGASAKVTPRPGRSWEPLPTPLLPIFPVAPRRGSPLGARAAPALAVPKYIPGVCPGGNAAAALLQTI